MSTSNFSAKIDELHMMKDAADRRRLEEEKEKDLGTLLENLPDVISRYDRDLRYVYVSPAIEKITGLPPQAFIGKTDRELKMPEDLCDTWQRTLERVFKIGMPEDVDFAYPSSRGLQYFESRLTPEFAGDGQVQYVLAVSRDVTRSRKAEAALKESEARYREIVEDQTEMICRFRPDGVLTFVNEAYCRYFHHGRDELIGRSFQPLIHEDDRELVANLLVSLSPSNPVIIIENRIILPDGAVRWNRWTDRAIYDREGSLQEIQAIGWDITEQKLAQTALKESRRRLADIFDFLPDATFVIDRAGEGDRL